MKSGNAGCYHGNVVPEALFKVCQKMELTFNEPCKGKDQCDRECATLKSLRGSYFDAGSDIITPDVFMALHYGNGLKYSQVCVAEISEDTVLHRKGITRFSDNHSISFNKDHMVLH